MITLFVIYWNTSSTPIGFSPGFLSNGIKSHARNASKDNDKFSAVHNFVITSAEVLHKSVVLSPNWVDANSLFQPSASSPDGPASPHVLNVAFLTLSASIEANLNGFTSSGLSVDNTSESALRLGGCYCLTVAMLFRFEEEYHFPGYPSVVWLRYERFLSPVATEFPSYFVNVWCCIGGLKTFLNFFSFFSKSINSLDPQSSVFLSNALRTEYLSVFSPNAGKYGPE